jgi:hypothetical protein
MGSRTVSAQERPQSYGHSGDHYLLSVSRTHPGQQKIRIGNLCHFLWVRVAFRKMLSFKMVNRRADTAECFTSTTRANRALTLVHSVSSIFIYAARENGCLIRLSSGEGGRSRLTATTRIPLLNVLLPNCLLDYSAYVLPFVFPGGKDAMRSTKCIQMLLVTAWSFGYLLANNLRAARIFHSHTPERLAMALACEDSLAAVSSGPV